MLGAYDFCGHYEWTFGWLEKTGGRTLLREYWDQAISQDSQQHLEAVVRAEGFDGMRKYWAHTLTEESPQRAFTLSEAPGVFRIDMHDCPSKGFLLRNGLANCADYCDHCIGWIGPLMQRAGFVIDHEHNHCGQCWWELRRKEASDTASPADRQAASPDVRSKSNWLPASGNLDRYRKANDPDDKLA